MDIGAQMEPASVNVIDWLNDYLMTCEKTLYNYCHNIQGPCLRCHVYYVDRYTIK